MKLRDITPGEHYAIKWGDTIVRGIITYAGTEREYTPRSDTWTNATITGARVFFTILGEYSRSDHEVDVPPANVIRPWAEEQAERDEKAQAEAGREARLAAVSKTLGVPLAWKTRHNGKVSEQFVVASFEDLERLARRLRRDEP